MKVAFGNPTIYWSVDSKENCTKWIGPDLDASKKLKNDLEAEQPQSVAKDAQCPGDSNFEY